MHIQIMYLHTSMRTPNQPLRKTLVADARAAVDACAGWNARLAARRITAFLNRRMQDSGLSLAQFSLMAQIAAARDDTLSELAQRIGLDQSTLSRNLQVLEAAALVEIAAGEKDARRRGGGARGGDEGGGGRGGGGAGGAGGGGRGADHP